MSKSLGNFMTIDECIKTYGADATRIAVADAGDTLDDANFVETVADNSVLRLWQLEQWIQAAITSFDKLRNTEDVPNDKIRFYDSVFLSQLEKTLINVDKCYETMKHRDVLKYGFFDLLALKEDYKHHCGTHQMRKDVFLKYLETQLIVMYPIIPHFCDMMWKKYYIPNAPASQKNVELITQTSWPHVTPLHNYDF